MPRGDRTGPEGMGPMTGRAAGYCAGYDRPGTANQARGCGLGLGLGRGRGGGGGRGWRNWFRATGLPRWMRGGPGPGPQGVRDPQPDREFLEQRAAALKAELAAVNQRLAGTGQTPADE